MMIRFTAGILMLFSSISCAAQYFQFSQYNFTPQRINPALVASSDYKSAAFLFRRQSTAGGFHLNSNSLQAMYPFLLKSGRRWSGVGISLLDDRSGPASIYSTQEAALSYAVNVDVASDQSFSVGVRLLYQNRRIDMSGLYTGSQYLPDRGFDGSLSTGEDLGSLRNSFVTFSAGLHWQKVTDKGIPLATMDISFFDFNKPNDAFISETYALSGSFVIAGSIRAYKRDNMSVYPEVLFTQHANTRVVNAGAVFRCDLRSDLNEIAPHVDMITKYIFGRSGLLGLQYHNERFSIGVSYDLPLFVRNVANLGAFEVGVALKKLSERSRNHPKNRKARVGQRSGTPKEAGRKLGTSIGVKKPVARPAADSIREQNEEKTNLSSRLKQKQDSVATQAAAGEIKHEPLVLEKATLHFNFEFNSSTPDGEATGYLDGLAQALLDNPALQIMLVGHTDNVGSAKFNTRLSLQRATSMKDYLVTKGVPAERIAVDGKGMTQPLHDNDTEAHRSLNRRVELTILYGR